MDYEQMEIDITLESDRDLKENMQATAKFALGQIMEYQHPTKVKNRHEGYGIAAEGYASLQGKMKSTKTDMDDLLKLLPNGDGDVLNVIGSLYNSAVEVAVESIKLAAQAQRIMDDLRWKNTWTSRKQERQRMMASRKQTITKKMQRKWRNKTWQRTRWQQQKRISIWSR